MVEWIKPPKNQNFLSYPIRKSNTQKNPGIYFLEMKCLLPAEIDDSGEKREEEEGKTQKILYPIYLQNEPQIA